MLSERTFLGWMEANQIVNMLILGKFRTVITGSTFACGRITEEMLQAESGKVLELDEEIRRQNQLIISLKAQVVTDVNMLL